MKKLLFPVVLLLFILLVATTVFLWWRQKSMPVSNDTKSYDFLVAKGRGASQIGEELGKNRLIKSPLAFKIYVQITGKAKNILSGQFKISPSFSLVQVVDTLTKPPAELWVTVPEGLRHEEVAERFIKGLEIKETEREAFRQEFLTISEDKEGFLFPDTYLFPRTTLAKNIVAKMRSTFDIKTRDFDSAISASDLTLAEIITLASIVERETKTDSERPVVAGILLNRLEIGMGLQADATVQYATANVKCQMSNVKCENWWPILTKEDLAINSPYNTYKFRGLPPFPIANPGLSSIKAAIYPGRTDYLYYLHDAEGQIHYAKTLAEHNENVRRYLGK